MEIIENPLQKRESIEEVIRKYGYTPDHNFDWLMYCSDEGEPKIAFWKDKAVWFYENSGKKEATIVSDPIAPPDDHPRLLSELTKYIFDSGIEKILFLDVRDKVNDFYRTGEVGKYDFYYDIDWPVVNMDSFDPRLPGGKFKDIRNALNKFKREHRVEIKSANLLNKEDLHGIVDRWMDNRTNAGIEELYPVRYHNMIDGAFRGTKSARVMLVDGKAVGFNAGWETPNTTGEWSAAVGTHDFSVKDLGVALLMEDLVWIKDAGYKICDLEGSDPPALRFKTQFFSLFDTYKTYTFWLKIRQ